MKKSVAVLLAVILILTTVSSSVLAFNGSFGSSSTGLCLKDQLTDKQRVLFTEIIDVFRARMLELRELMHSYRDAGDYEAFRSIHAERFVLMEERRDALRKILPEELAEHFQKQGRTMRHFGRDRNSGGFNSNQP